MSNFLYFILLHGVVEFSTLIGQKVLIIFFFFDSISDSSAACEANHRFILMCLLFYVTISIVTAITGIVSQMLDIIGWCLGDFFYMSFLIMVIFL